MKSIVAARAFAVLALCAFGGAQEAQAQAGMPCAGVLKSDCLPQTLSGMGFDAKPLGEGFLILIERDGWKLYVDLIVSSDNSKVGFNSNLGTVNEQKVSAAQWMGLVAANKDIDPSVFFYDAAKKTLYIHRVLDNRSVTPAILRDQLDRFLADIRSSEKIWSPVAQ
jgi:hypothetical protein